MLAVALGYPLGTLNDKYLVECNNKGVMLTFEEAAVWMNFNGIKEINDAKEDKITIIKLASSGLIVIADSLEELWNKVMGVVPVRQGAGTLDEGKTAIFLGEHAVRAEGPYFSAWQLCNGKRRISDIYKFIEKDYKISKNDFLKLISYLDEQDLIFFT